ncbi:MAG: hypothetical protein ACI8T1_000699 [Verrucomicrobiales bacterium]|jgi:hypothetical protein
MSMMTLMFVCFGLYFLYDGFVGYPKKNKIFEAHQEFVEIQEKKEAFLAEGNLNADWKALAEKEGYPEQDEWIDYAATKGWPEEPPEKFHSTTDQFFFGALCIGIGLAVLGTMLLNRRKVLCGDDTSFTSPNGQRVFFSSAYRIDKRKWDNKGLAYVHYRDVSEKEKRAIIDDLKFAGADKILDNLMANFDGELVERVSTEPNEPAEDDAEAPKASSKDKEETA